MQIAYVNVFVNDLTRAITFYESHLGLELTMTAPEYGYAAFMAGAIKLAIVVPGPGQPAITGRHTGVGFEVDDLESEHARLEALGVSFSMPPTRQPWGGFMALFADPDGNVFYLDQSRGARG